MRYKNLSSFTKVFYGVEIKPGEVKDIPGNVNDPEVIRWFGDSQPETKSEKVVPAESKAETTTSEKTDSTESAPKSRKRSVKEA